MIVYQCDTDRSLSWPSWKLGWVSGLNVGHSGVGIFFSSFPTNSFLHFLHHSRGGRRQLFGDMDGGAGVSCGDGLPIVSSLSLSPL